jgi:hypothetical protein
MPFYGFPLQVAPRSLTSLLMVEPTLGIDASQPSVDAPLGSTPQSQNFIMREGGLEMRPVLQLRTANPQPMAAPVTGGWEFSDTLNNHYPVVSGTSRLAWFSTGSWSQLSYVSAFGLNDPPAGSGTSYWDATQIYYALQDEHIAVLANGSYQSLYCWQSNKTVFSTLTGAPRAKHITAFDNYLLAFNIRDSGSATSDYVQRVQWSDRGSASSWTGGLSGFEDLLAMRGQGTRIVAQDNRIILFSEAEIWQGFPSNFPFVFRFEPLDRSVGCPYSWTISDTPQGLVFLARNLQAYLLPKGGGPAVPIGQRLHRVIRETIDAPERAWAVYDQATDQHELFYPVLGGSGLPQRAVFLNLTEGSWAPQSFDPLNGGYSLTRGFAVTGVAQSSSATSWDGAGAAGLTWDNASRTWDSFNTQTVTADRRDVYIGSSAGTVFLLDSVATMDNGVAVPCTWRSTALWGEMPSREKTVTEWRADYQGNSASSVTIRFSQNQGASFDPGLPLRLPANSALSQAVAYPYISARFPMFQVESEGQRYRLFRFFLTARVSGR